MGPKKYTQEELKAAVEAAKKADAPLRASALRWVLKAAGVDPNVVEKNLAEMWSGKLGAAADLRRQAQVLTNQANAATAEANDVAAQLGTLGIDITKK